MKKPNIHVVHKSGQWAVEAEGASDDATKFSTKEDAVAAGKEMARKGAVELLVHREDGSIGERDSYGHDPRNVPG
jgi:Uncharacterized protein conserved in bacteria (DUF2188)